MEAVQEIDIAQDISENMGGTRESNKRYKWKRMTKFLKWFDLEEFQTVVAG